MGQETNRTIRKEITSAQIQVEKKKKLWLYRKNNRLEWNIPFLLFITCQSLNDVELEEFDFL